MGVELVDKQTTHVTQTGPCPLTTTNTDRFAKFPSIPCHFFFSRSVLNVCQFKLVTIRKVAGNFSDKDSCSCSTSTRAFG
ncbi:hypothetical protein PM082_023018 [Marasmius tenuissimus]|nr:hypothetical protein PM082_023018 [Marasmius tenuissimus]